jgi:hypothetical protein
LLFLLLRVYFGLGEVICIILAHQLLLFTWVSGILSAVDALLAVWGCGHTYKKHCYFTHISKEKSILRSGKRI